MLFNLNDNPFEMQNFVGHNGLNAPDQVIGKAVQISGRSYYNI
jgi:hypothetical protein